MIRAMYLVPLLALAACTDDPKTHDSSGDSEPEGPVSNFTIDFEPPSYAVGVLNGQAGWVTEFDIAVVQTSKVKSGSQELWFDFSVAPSEVGSNAYFPLVPPEGTRKYTVSMDHTMDSGGDWSGFALTSEGRYVASVVGRSKAIGYVEYSQGVSYTKADTGWNRIGVVLDLDTMSYECFVDDISLGVTALEFDPPVTALDTLVAFGYQGKDFATGYLDNITVDMSP